MSYTVRIKEETSKIENTKSELIAELSGYIRNNGTIQDEKVIMTTENKSIVDHIKASIESLYNIEPQIKMINNVNFSKKILYQITINTKETKILNDLGILDSNNHYLETVPNYVVGGNEEIRAYLRGVFNSTGSINDPKTSRYHMELLITHPKEAVFIQKLLNLFDLNAKILNREKGLMIYIKEAEKISDFLKIIGATNAVLYFEDVRIYRERKNATNRLNNMEQANMDKVIQTATTQLEEIQIIEENDGVMLLDDKVKQVLEYRKKYPETSLKELAEIISLETGKTISKSGLNHRLRKIKELAESFQKMNKEKAIQKNE